MHGVRRQPQYLCARCLRARAQFHPPSNGIAHKRYASDVATPPERRDGSQTEPPQEPKEEGALSRRLAQMSEEALETGGKGAQNAVKEAGFSEDLKRELEEKIANASFRSEHANAFAQANLPSSAGKQTRETAAASPWMGTESIGDASLRMLNDAHKPLKAPTRRSPSLRGPPPKVDTGRPRERATGARLANARDKTSAYAFMKDPNMSPEEREKLRQEMKARFQPAGRVAPATIQGLASLANERIEDAIARGQFKNIPRGKKIERDYNASSPFIDTTEYFMNKIIQKQEIVPPWIEKQQELVSTATRFRSRLRADWRRHVSRMIASRGGSLEQQMAVANQYALAENRENPAKRKEETINAVADDGQVSQITLAGELKPTPTAGGLPPSEEEIKIVEQVLDEDGSLRKGDQEEQQIILSTEQPTPVELSPPPETPPSPLPTVPPFRDPQWQTTELSYHVASIANLNSLTRSYNLMAPDLAKKPYFSLDRELRACFADVAPTVAGAIRERALAPKIRGVEVIGHRPGGVLEKFGMDRAGHVTDERKPQYGFREFWRDLFAK